MSDRVFYNNNGPFFIKDIAKTIGAKFEDNQADVVINDIKSLTEASSGEITFLNNKKYLKDLKTSKASACIVAHDVELEDSDIIFLKVRNPYHEYNKLIDLFYTSARKIKAKISPSAYVSPSAKIGNNCYIGHNVVIEEEVEIGDNVVIESGSFIDFKVKIGNNARIDSNVSISHSIIGNDVVILPGARIGQDGFGFSTEKGVHKKIYHTGRVIIGNDVEIGANTTIDRGSMNDTIVEDLCRIDNLVQIGHNVHIKKGAIIVSQAGIAGSSTIGSYCAIGGQVGVAGHVSIADGVQIAGQSGVLQDIKEPGAVLAGSPVVPIRDWHKQTITMRKLIKKKI